MKRALLRRILSAGASQENREKWEKVKSKGVLRFVLVQGVLGWGGLMFLITTPLFFILLRLIPDHASRHHAVSAAHLALASVIPWMVGGLAWGVATWFGTDAFYRFTDRAV